MVIFFKIGKYIIQTICLLLLVFSFILVFFIYKPSSFLNNIENYFSSFLENHFLNISVSIDKIEGDFYSGFTIKNIHVKSDSSYLMALENISIKPNLKEIFYGKLVFTSIEIENCKINDINKIQLNKSVDVRSNFLIPKIIIDNFSIDKGAIQYRNNDFIFSGNFFGHISSDESKFQAKAMNITFNDNIYLLNTGSVYFDKGNCLFDNIVLLDKNNIKSKIFIDFDLVPFKINKTDISFDGLDISVGKRARMLGIDILSNNKDHRLNYNLIINLILNNKQNHHLIVNGNYKNNTLSFNLENEKIFNDVFSVNGLYRPLKKSGLISFSSDDDNMLKLNGDMNFIISDNLTFYFDVLLSNSSYKKFNFDKLSGDLIYKNSTLTSSNMDMKISNNVNIRADKLFFKSLDDFFVSGNLEAIRSKEADSHQLNKLLNINFKNVSTTNLSLSYDYIKNSSIDKLSFEGHSKSAIIDQVNLFNIKYNFLYNDGKVSEYMITADNLNFFNYSFENIRANYSNDNLIIESKNINSGEYLNLDLDILSNNIFINKINGKINNTNIVSEKILINKDKNKYKSSDMILFIGQGYLDMDINFKDINNYSVNILLNNIDLNKMDKLLFLNNRYNGTINGEFYMSCKNIDSLFVLTDLTIENSKIDNFEYQNMIFKASLRNNLISVSDFSGINEDSSFDISGTIEKKNQSTFKILSPLDRINFSGYLSNIDISSLNMYIPWTFKIGGELTSPLSIIGTLENLNIEIDPIVKKIKFDKIKANEVSGKISYRNHRIYFTDMFGKTDFGTYRLNGSIPADFDYFGKQKNIIYNPIYVDINAKSKSLELLTPYFPFIKNLDGNFEYTLNIHGNYNKPIRDGEIIIKDANLDIFEQRSEYTFFLKNYFRY